MAYISVEESFAAKVETTNGTAVTPTLEANSIEVESAEFTVNETPVERANYPRAARGDLPPQPGLTAWGLNITVPGKYDGAGGSAEVEPLLIASGLSETSEVFTPNAAQSSDVNATLQMTDGDYLKTAFGCALNCVWSAKAGDISRFAFSGMGTYREPVSGAISGSTYTVDSTFPIVFQGSGISMGSWLSPHVSEFSFDFGNEVKMMTLGGSLQHPVEYAYSHDQDAGAAAGFVDETTDINESTADDVSPFPAAVVAVNDAFYLGSVEKFSGALINLTTKAVGTFTAVLEYYNGSSWTTLTTLRAQLSTFTENVGWKWVEWEPPSDWATTTAGNTGGSPSVTTAFWVRWRISAYTSMGTKPLIGQGYALHNGRGYGRAIIMNRKPRLTLTVEAEAASTFNPITEWQAKTQRTITIPVGRTQYATITGVFTSCVLAAHPTFIDLDGYRAWNLTYIPDMTNATPWSITFS